MRSFVLFVTLAVAVCMPALAQDFESRLGGAALDGRADEVSALIRASRLEVKPVVQGLVTEYVRSRLDAEPSADRIKAAVHLIADQFESAFGERSLAVVAGQLDGWSDEELADKQQADSLLAAGVAIRTDDREAAGTAFAAARDLYARIGDRHGLAEVLGQVAYVTFYLDRARYIDLNLEALAARRAVDDRQLTGNTLNDLGLGNRLITRDYDAALEYYFEGRRIRQEIGDMDRLASLVSNIGRTYEAMGVYPEASRYFLEGAEHYLAAGDTANWIIQRNNTVGLLTNYADRHADALVLGLEVRRDLALTSDTRAEALVGNLIGVIRRRLGDYHGAVEEYREVIRIAERDGYPELLARALNNIGVVFIFMGTPERAVPFLQRSLAAGPTGEEVGQVNTLLSLSSAHYQLRDYPEAQKYLDLARLEPADRGIQAAILKMTADIKLRSGREQEARADYDQLMALADELSTPHLRSAAYFGLAEADERLDRVDSALENYELAAHTLELERGELSAEEDKAGHLAQTRYLYEEIIHFLTKAALKQPDGPYAGRAFEFAERGKSRAFLDMMAEALAGVREGVDPELQSDLDALAQNMAYLRGELADPASDAGKVAELKGHVRDMEAEYERVEREMRERNPRFAAMRYPDPTTLADVQTRILKSGELMLAYALGDSSSTLWAITPQSVAIHQLPERSAVEPQVEAMRFALENPGQPIGDVARQLYDILVHPAASGIERAEHVIVVPDGVLHYLPFEALLTGEAPDSYLLAKAPVSYAQSASVLGRLREEPPVLATRALLAVGDPAFGGTIESGFLRGEALSRLPFTGEEVQGIARLFDASKVDVLVDESATETAVQNALEANTYRFVHFATHGLINDDRPDYSGLALAGTGTDALLQASEILNLHVPAELVVLSACETGLGQLVKGEGVVGLTRSFMYAGAQSVAVSLWSVSDRSTAGLMDTFYKRMAEGSTKHDALRDAKRALLQAPETAHPFHWAAFVMVGRGD